MAEPRRTRRSRWRSVRARTTAGATLVMALALIGGATAFYAILNASVIGAVERTAETRAEEIADLADDGGSAAIDGLEDEIVQLVGADGVLIAASEEAREDVGGALPVSPVSPDSQRMTIDDELVLVLSEEVDDGVAVVLAVPIEDEVQTLGTVATLLAIGAPLVLTLVSVTTWLVVGRALRPVTRIRREVEGITADRLDRRVPVPDSADEVASLATTMNGMLDRLDAAAQAQRRFVSDASHELRSPLATIRQHAELAQAHPEVTSVDELAEVVSDEGLRLQGIVESLLLLARLDEGATPHAEPVDLDDLALAEVRRLRARGIDTDGTGIRAARVDGDPRLLGQLVRNLADNAARHATQRIAIGVSPVGDRVVLTVEDDGDGVPESERDRIFERFVRLDDARSRDAGGSGLGLAIVSGIAAAEGGSVTVDESRWGGARFVVSLPASS